MYKINDSSRILEIYIIFYNEKIFQDFISPLRKRDELGSTTINREDGLEEGYIRLSCWGYVHNDTLLKNKHREI